MNTLIALYSDTSEMEFRWLKLCNTVCAPEHSEVSSDAAKRLSLQKPAVVSLCIKNTSENVAAALQSTAKSADVPINPVLPNMYNYGSNYV